MSKGTMLSGKTQREGDHLQSRYVSFKEEQLDACKRAGVCLGRIPGALQGILQARYPTGPMPPMYVYSAVCVRRASHQQF